jgi:peroxiredoxin-like protein
VSAEKHIYRLQGEWKGGERGSGSVSLSSGTAGFDFPPDLDGKPGFTNPEEMLVAAVVACYTLTLTFLAARRKIDVVSISVSAEGDVERQPDQSLKFTALRLKPRIAVGEADETARARLLDLAQKAEHYCTISNAIKGNVSLSVEPAIA